MAAKREIFHPPAWHWTTSKSPYNINTKRSLQMLRINKLITNRTRIIIETIFCNCLADVPEKYLLIQALTVSRSKMAFCENLVANQDYVFLFMNIFILITYLLENVLILLGEIYYWSLYKLPSIQYWRHGNK